MSSFLNVLLSTDKKQRVRIRRSLLASVVFCISITSILFLALMDRMAVSTALILSLGMVMSCLGFYIALRSTFNLRFKEPALTVPQVLVAMAWICIAYATTGIAHTSTLMLFALVMVFGIFVMDARSSIIAAWYACLLLALTMIYKVITEPSVYLWDAELVSFLLFVTMMTTIAFLSQQLARIRNRLKTQKQELEVALTHIQKIAAHDELTGLINRRRMTEVLAEHSRNHSRQTEGFAIAMLDLDYFKQINDKYGHAVGDMVLASFGEAARKVLRDIDVLSRWGGEEFLLLMPKTNSGHPNTGIERLRAYLACIQVSPKLPELRIGFSVGFTCHAVGESIYDTIKRADAALYQAKAQGRNCTVID